MTTHTKILCILLASLLFVSTAFAEEGVEKGDTEIQFLGLYFTGTGDAEFDYGNIQFSYGKYLTDKLLLGIGPGLSITSSGGDTTTTFSTSFFATYNFVTNKRTIPYAKAAWYQGDWETEGDQDLMDKASVQVGGGLKHFINEYAAIDGSIVYGFSMADENDDGTVMLMVGISFIF